MHNADDLDEQSWEQFSPDPDQPVPTQKMREHIEQHVGLPPVRSISWRWMAAASVAVLAGIAGLRYWKSEKPPVVATAAKSQKVQQHVAIAKQVFTNTTSATQFFTLPDGSKVRLSKHSSIAFDSGFIAARTGVTLTNGGARIDDSAAHREPTPRRDIFLTGEAVFTVTQDKTKPFTVHSKDLAVTALGTVFGVDATHGSFTTVLLYSGKVVVKKQEPSGRPFSDVYLAPGQQITVNHNDLSVSIRTFLPTGNGVAEKTPAPIPRQLMTFTRQPLIEIFNELHNTYHITISYDAATVKNMDFTGTFNSEKESLESFLNTLCDLNELQLKKTGKGFAIEPKQP